MAEEPFELGLLGGAIERGYRRGRPEIERMPWGTLALDGFSPAELAAARSCWMKSAFLEHKTAAACADALRALIVARAPLDLIALASRFPLDELAHVELCVRFVNELGSAAPPSHDPAQLVPRAAARGPLAEAAELIVRCFCVGEALSVPLLRATWRQTEHPLPRAILGRIVKDEAAHGELGWIFLDWALPQLGADDRAHLRMVAARTIASWRASWKGVQRYHRFPRATGRQLGWLDPVEYAELAHQVLGTDVVEPLAARGLA